MQKHYPISEAKNHLPAIIHAVEDGEAVKLTRHGKPVAVLLSTAQYQDLIQPHIDLWEAVTSFRKSSSDLLENDDFSDMRDISKGRKVTFDI